MSRHVYLIGMPGSGKSSVGRVLAELLGLPFLDLDHEIERAAGKSIPEIFRNDGEGAFRLLERDTLQRVAAGPAAVVACGGGAPLRDDNRELIRTTGKVVWLHAPPARLWKRIRPFSRPLIKGPIDVTRIARERDAVYREVAEHRVEAAEDPHVVARRVAEALR